MKKSRKERNNELRIIAQNYGGNRRDPIINKNEVDAFLSDFGKSGALDEQPAAKVKKTIILVPGTDNIAIVFDKNAEDHYVNVEFPEDHAKKAPFYKEYLGKDYKMRVTCHIPELDTTLHTRCFACRLDKDGNFESLELNDIDKFMHYFPEY
ncbi:MAG: hypothetical protein Q4B73_10315 [Lachnospiraceae bacterium]|nr:hypothetical protein [Lachnospiraceae bacterium]